MKRIPIIVTTAFAFGFMAALMTMSGCTEPATRTFTLFQFQSTKTNIGPFRIDTSEIPPNAIESQTETGGPGKPETRLTLNSNYEIEIVLRLVDKNENRTHKLSTRSAVLTCVESIARACYMGPYIVSTSWTSPQH